MREEEAEESKRNETKTARTTIQLMFCHSYSAYAAAATDRKLIDKLQFPRYAWITNTHLLHSIPHSISVQCTQTYFFDDLVSSFCFPSLFVIFCFVLLKSLYSHSVLTFLFASLSKTNSTKCNNIHWLITCTWLVVFWV